MGSRCSGRGLDTVASTVAAGVVSAVVAMAATVAAAVMVPAAGCSMPHTHRSPIRLSAPHNSR